MGAMALPSWIDPDEPKPAPGRLLVVQGFVNTRDIDAGSDLLADPDSAARWLGAAGLIDPGAEIGRAELAAIRDFREGLRALIVANGGGPAAGDTDLAALRRAAARRRPQLSVEGGGRLRLREGAHADAADALLGLLVAVYEAQADGTWSRLKACANSDCRWVFFDRSRNRHGTWCEMAACGNRIKNRHLRARQSAAAKPTDAAAAPPAPSRRAGRRRATAA
jgi:predicted RNA-binding Zn ribbon-like protein